MGAINFSLDNRLVQCLQSALPLRLFFETGTFKGDTIVELETFFDNIISVELSEPLWQTARNKFIDSSHISILHGRSDEKLTELQNQLSKQSVLFWLDAHWCEDENSSGTASECPLISELEAIGTLNKKSVILIDDARLFLAPPPAPHNISQWPTFNELLFQLQKLSSEHELMVVNDILAYYPHQIKEEISNFAHENGVDWLIYHSQLAAEQKNSSLQAKSLKESNSLAKNLRKQVKDKASEAEILRKQVKEKASEAEILRKQVKQKQKALKLLTSQSEEKEQVIANLLLNQKPQVSVSENASSKESVTKNAYLELKSFVFPKFWFIQRIGQIFKPRLGNLRQYIPRPITTLKPVKAIPENKLSFAIVTPSYNQGLFISQTIKSVLSQNYPYFEYFVQDGKSNDETLNVIKSYEKKLAGWESKIDTGQSQAINMGFSKISGDIMCWLNSDDIMLPGTLQAVSNYFYKHPNVDVIYGNRLQIDVNDSEIGRWILPGHDEKVLLFADFVPQETLFWRRSVWGTIGNQVDESFNFAMDWDLISRFIDAKARFAHIPRFLGAFRVHKEQKTSSSIHDLGYREMNKIRKRNLGFIPTTQQIRRKVMPFLLKHLFVDMIYRIKSRLGG